MSIIRRHSPYSQDDCAHFDVILSWLVDFLARCFLDDCVQVIKIFANFFGFGATTVTPHYFKRKLGGMPVKCMTPRCTSDAATLRAALRCNACSMHMHSGTIVVRASCNHRVTCRNHRDVTETEVTLRCL